MPVYIVFGIGGEPEDPKALYLVPLSVIKSHIVEKNDIRDYNKSTIDNFFYKRELDKLT